MTILCSTFLWFNTYRNMKECQALGAFAALSQQTRLSVLRLLIKAGNDGVSAGMIAEEIGVSASNISFHLKELERAGLITQRRESRSIIYAADYSGLRGLIEFLTMDCCAGRPEITGPIVACCTPGQPAAKRRS
jgi:ArsR family transcriptional regulator, arsenate/arsenite/antimonite-responsive transcriptional repressor